MVKSCKNIIFAFTYVLESLALLYGYFSMNSYTCIVDGDEVMKRGDEALNASLLQVFRSIKHFMTSLLLLNSAFNAS